MSAGAPAFRLEEALLVLRRTPAVLDALLRGAGDGWLLADEGPETFSPREVVGHLIHGERTDWVPRARIILEHGESRPFDPYDRFAQRREMEGKSTDQLLDEFAALRLANLRTVESWRLDQPRLALRGRHPSLGTVTLAQLMATWTAHDLSHLGQVVRVMGKRYRADVGPWVEYLPMLTR